MGYYHDTVLTLTAATNALLMTALKAASSENNELFADAVSTRTADPTTKAVLYHWNYYKWSDCEAEFVSSFLESIDEDSFRYIRLGENYADVEAWGELEEPFDPRVDAKLIYNTASSVYQKQPKGDSNE